MMVPLRLGCLVLALLLVPGARPATAMEGLETGLELLAARRYNAARAVFERLVAAQPEHAMAHAALCRTHLALGDSKRAITHCKRAVALDDTHADFYFWLGRSYGAAAVRSDPLKQALLAPKIKRAFERAVALDPRHVGAHVGLTNYYLRAPALMGGSLDKARTQADILTNLHAVKGTLLHARIDEAQKRPEAAETRYRELLQRYPEGSDHDEIVRAYGHFLLRQRRAGDALPWFRALVERRPDWARAHVSLGDAYRALKRLPEALAAYREALRLDPHADTAQRKLTRTEQDLTRTQR